MSWSDRIEQVFEDTSVKTGERRWFEMEAVRVPAATESVAEPVAESAAVSAVGSVVDSVGARERAAGVTSAMLLLADAVAGAGVWSTQVRRDVLAQLERSIDGLVAARAAVLVAEKESGAWQGAGDRSFEAWWGRTSRGGQRSASTQVRAAEQLDAVPAVVEAVTQGRIGLDHAVIIARVAAAGTSAQRDAAQSPQGQQELVGLAERLDAGTFATTAARWAASVDPAALEADHQGQRAARYLHVVDTKRGTVIKGLLDCAAGHRLTLALEAVTPKPGADDDREPEQRRADALDTIATSILSSADTKPGAHVPPQVTLILTEQTWLAARAERQRQRSSRAAFGFGPADDNAAGSGTGGLDLDFDSTGADTGDGPWTAEAVAVGYLPATLEDGTPVPVSELAIAMCECDVTRVVIDADGVPMDLGRTERVFTGVHRRAVIARDRECAWPDCHAHARWCQIHHLRWWERDLGPTSVENGMLLCNFHHHEVHRRDLSITRHPLRGRTGTAAVRARGAMARVGYDFREPNGHLIGAPPPTSNPPLPTPRLSSPPPSPSPTADLDFIPTADCCAGMADPSVLIA